MSHPAKIHPPVFVALALTCSAALWWGCEAGSSSDTTWGTTTTSTSSSSGDGGTGGMGGIDVSTGGNAGGEGWACVSTSAEAKRIPVDLVFLVDRSASMNGEKWAGTTSALSTFFNDPGSFGVSAGMEYVPTAAGCECDFTSYMVLDVPIAQLPDNAFALMNSMPAAATGACTPNYGGLKGALMAATAYQDAHPTHKVNVVFATDGEAWTSFGCDPVTIDVIADLAKSALNYNGVHTYVIGVDGSLDTNLDKIAEAGGTGASYDVTVDISQFVSTLNEIRNVAVGCEFEIPPPPSDEEIDPDKVNFSYTPQGMGMSKLLLRANDLAGCDGGPGWYYDNNSDPKKIILCPASCSTVQADTKAKVEVLFGCKSLLK